MSLQIPFDFNAKKSRERRDEGMYRAETKACKENPGWSEKAYEFLKGYAEINPVFMAEDIRYASQGLPEVRSQNQRSWGAIFARAAKNGIIYRDGYEQVKNVKAHATPATRWKSLICKR